MANIIGLYIYPIKSCGRVSLDTMLIDNYGPVWDRHWMVVDTSGKFVTQREVPSLAHMKVKMLDYKKGEFELSYKDKPKLMISPSNSTEEMAVKVWEWDVRAIKCSEQINTWFSDIVGRPVLLVENSKEITRRQVKEKYGENYFKFADGLPLLLIGSGSLDLLNSKLKEPINIHSFRTNIFVQTSEAHIEDSWQNIKINQIGFDLVKRCSRCVMINIDQDTGKKNPYVLKTLSSYRRGQKGIQFGQNLTYKSTGEIRMGEPLLFNTGE